MTRAALALTALALAVPIALPALGSARPGEGAAPSADCTWKRHSKRVVKKVRRHGKVRRVVRVKHWWTCRRAPAAPELGAATPRLPASGQPAPTEPGPTVARLSVKALEYSFTLSRPSVTAGEAIVELNNQGEDPHNLNLQLANGQGPELHVPEAGSLKRTSERFTLPAGTYRLWCSIPDHEALGMKATLAVTG